MRHETNSPGAVAAATGAEAGYVSATQLHSIAPTIPDASLGKRGILLRAFLEGEALTRLEAWRVYGDGCANTTVSDIEHLHGVRIARHMEEVAGRHRQAHVARYWLDHSDRPDALRALARELRSAGFPDEAADVLKLIDGEVA